MVYDENGNLIQKGDTTYTWNARNQLIGITNPTINASFKYDALGRRIEKTINGKTTQYLYDGLDIIQEIESGMVTVNYLRTLNIDEPLARIKSDGAVRYYQTDALGSVVALTDEAGTIKTQYVYDPYGNTTVIGEPSDNPFQFVGKENDGTGLMREGYRYYSFELQRYISEDPIGFAGGDINFYVRVGNNPVNFVDPLGLISKDTPTFLYQKLSKTGKHLKYGITKDPSTRYTTQELAGGRLKILAKGTREEMLALERKLHRTLLRGPEERQCQYGKLQRNKLQGVGRVLGVLGFLSTIINAYEVDKIAEETGKSIWQVQLEMMGYSYDYPGEL